MDINNEYLVMDNYFLKIEYYSNNSNNSTNLKNSNNINLNEKIYFLYSNDIYYIIQDGLLEKYFFYKYNDGKKIYLNDKIKQEITKDSNLNSFIDILFIINIDNSTDLKNILNYLSKKSNIIININNELINNNNYFDFLINSYENLIITKYKNMNTLNFLQNINDDLLNFEDNCYENIIYINKFDENFINSIINIITHKKIEYNSIYTISNKYVIANNVLFEKIKLPFLTKYFSYQDLCILVIIFYITNHPIFKILDTNFMINKYIFKHLLEYDLTKKYYI